MINLFRFHKLKTACSYSQVSFLFFLQHCGNDITLGFNVFEVFQLTISELQVFLGFQSGIVDYDAYYET